MFDRLRGVADALAVDLADDAYDPSRLGAPPAAPGCSAVFVPARRVSSGHPLVSRAFDLAGPLAVERGTPPSAARPYVLELHPDEGLPSIAVCAFDLVGGALDGVNADGLVVVAASEVESPDDRLEPAGASVGLDELQVVRHLLDGCATAAEARQVLLAAKLYYSARPAHWLVADRHGDAFVFEVSRGRNRVHLVEAAGEPLVATNHLLHLHPRAEPLPRSPDPGGTFARYRALVSGLAEARGALDRAGLSAIAARAFASGAVAPLRTLWHSVYDPVERSLTARFFGRRPADVPEVRFALG
jgi:hypothetical protein